MGACLPAEYPQGPVPTLWNEPPELPSGAGPFDAATTTARLSDVTAFPSYTSELEPEDTTHLHRLDAGDGTWLRDGLPAGCSRSGLGHPRCGFALYGPVTSQKVSEPPEVTCPQPHCCRAEEHLYCLLRKTSLQKSLRCGVLASPRSSC